MKKMLKTSVSMVIVMLGAFLTHFYLSYEISITSILAGVTGFIILFPAIKKWCQILWGDDFKF
jgi:hypothetical protein